MTDNDEPTRDELEQRVEQLEATVEKMLPNRRQTLTGLGLLAGGGLLGGSASGSTGAAGDVGTDQGGRPDVLADAVDANSVGTGKLSYDQGFVKEEDDNSPFNPTNAQELQYTVAGSYDILQFHVKRLQSESGDQTIEITVNEDTAQNYTYYRGDGTVNSGESSWVLDGLGREFSGKIQISATPDYVAIGVTGASIEADGTLVAGYATGTSEPINSVTFSGDAGEISINARVIGEQI